MGRAAAMGEGSGLGGEGAATRPPPPPPHHHPHQALKRHTAVVHADLAVDGPGAKGPVELVVARHAEHPAPCASVRYNHVVVAAVHQAAQACSTRARGWVGGREWDAPARRGWCFQAVGSGGGGGGGMDHRTECCCAGRGGEGASTGALDVAATPAHTIIRQRAKHMHSKHACCRRTTASCVSGANYGNISKANALAIINIIIVCHDSLSTSRHQTCGGTDLPPAGAGAWAPAPSCRGGTTGSRCMAATRPRRPTARHAARPAPGGAGGRRQQRQARASILPACFDAKPSACMRMQCMQDCVHKQGKRGGLVRQVGRPARRAGRPSGQPGQAAALPPCCCARTSASASAGFCCSIPRARAAS